MSRWGTFFSRANTARLATHLLALWKQFKHADTPWLAGLFAWWLFGSFMAGL
jgi:hypothetical protein